MGRMGVQRKHFFVPAADGGSLLRQKGRGLRKKAFKSKCNNTARDEQGDEKLEHLFCSPPGLCTKPPLTEKAVFHSKAWVCHLGSERQGGNSTSSTCSTNAGSACIGYH